MAPYLTLTLTLTGQDHIEPEHAVGVHARRREVGVHGLVRLRARVGHLARRHVVPQFPPPLGGEVLPVAVDECVHLRLSPGAGGVGRV